MTDKPTIEQVQAAKDRILYAGRPDEHSYEADAHTIITALDKATNEVAVVRDLLSEAAYRGGEYVDTIDNQQAEIERLRKALQQISKGEGPFSRDPLTHASNTIDAMKAEAVEALDETAEQEQKP